ncbi:hypothetical protein DPMN_142261 [Dreissena polymorpha]|uniref:Uncharacterized protein n=1 Tax=Dreissena polymorpha TaxID=45954 RepID=A0A9D4GE84_DREPO|nr:hypothetical protein DPMN_142261 [Dreissena polymorpha]
MHEVHDFLKKSEITLCFSVDEGSAVGRKSPSVSCPYRCRRKAKSQITLRVTGGASGVSP